MIMAMTRPETEMKDSGVKYIGLIPRTWKIVQLKYCTDCLDGKRVPIDASLRKSGIYPYWGAGRIMDYVDDYIFDERLVLLGEDGAPFFDDFRPVSHLIDGKIWVNNHIHVLRTKDNVVDSYLVHALNSVDYHEYINGSILNKLTQSNMNRIKIPLPSYIEQQAIADYLDETCSKIDEIIADAKASIDEYKELKQSAIFEAVTKGLDKNMKMKATGENWLPLVPNHWKMEKGKNLLFETNFRSADGQEELLTVSQYTGVTPRSKKNVTMFQSESLVDYKICEVGDIAANTMWMWAGAVGVSQYHGVISPSYNTYRQKHNDYDYVYLDYMLRIAPLVDEYASLSTGIRASRLRLYPKQFLGIIFPVPPFCEQRDIVEFLDKKTSEIDSLIFEKQSLIQDLEAYKKSLIYEVVTGKRRVV